MRQGGGSGEGFDHEARSTTFGSRHCMEGAASLGFGFWEVGSTFSGSDHAGGKKGMRGVKDGGRNGQNGMRYWFCGAQRGGRYDGPVKHLPHAFLHSNSPIILQRKLRRALIFITSTYHMLNIIMWIHPFTSRKTRRILYHKQCHQAIRTK